MPDKTLTGIDLRDRWPASWGASGTLVIAIDKGIVSDEGVQYPATSKMGSALRSLGLHWESAITVVGNHASAAAISGLPTTDTATPHHAARYNIYVYDSRGVMREKLNNRPFHLHEVLSDSFSWEEWVNANEFSQHTDEGIFLGDYNTIRTMLDAIAYANASTLVKGITKLSTAPVSATIPIAVGDNDDRVSAEYYTSIYSADIPTAVAAIATIVGSTPTTVVVSKSNATATTTYSVPSNILIRMVGAGKITVSSGRVLTFGGGFQAEGHRQRFAGSGLVRFTGTNTPDIFHIGWWGCVGDGVADDVIPYQAAIDATPDGYTLYHPNSFNCSITSKLKCNDRIALKLGNPSNFNSPYAGQTGKITWNGPANGAMLEMIDSNSCVVRGLYFAMTGSNTANTAAYGIFSTADYGLTLSGVTTNTNSPTVTFTGIGNGFMVDSLPNGDAVHRGRNIIIGGNTYVIASISDATAPGTLTLTTNALANVSGGTASIPHPQGYIHSSSSHIFEYLNFNWTTASTNVAYRTAICNDLYASVNHERVIIRNVTVFGAGGPAAQTSSVHGIAISFGGFYDSGSVDYVSPLAGYAGGNNVLQCHIEDVFIYSVSFGIHGMSGDIARVQGTNVNCAFFGGFASTISDSRFETNRQFLHGFGNITLSIPHFADAVSGVNLIEINGGASTIRMENGIRHFGGLLDGSGTQTLVCLAANATADVAFTAWVDYNTIATKRPVGFQNYRLADLNVREEVYGADRRTRIINKLSFAELASVATTFGGLINPVTGTTVIEALCTGVTAGSDPATSGGSINPVMYIETAGGGGRWKAY